MLQQLTYPVSFNCLEVSHVRHLCTGQFGVRLAPLLKIRRC